MIGANDVIWGGPSPVTGGSDLPDDKSESRPTSLSSAGAISTGSLLSPKTRLALKQAVNPFNDCTGGMYSCVLWGGGGEGGNLLAPLILQASSLFFYVLDTYIYIVVCVDVDIDVLAPKSEPPSLFHTHANKKVLMSRDSWR